MGTLIPTLGSPVPAPTVLAVVHCPLQLQVEVPADGGDTGGLQVDSALESIPVPKALAQKDESKVLSSSEATLLSITDDGRLWRWVITEEHDESQPASSTASSTGITFRGSGESNASGELVGSSSNGFVSDLIFKVCFQITCLVYFGSLSFLGYFSQLLTLRELIVSCLLTV